MMTKGIALLIIAFSSFSLSAHQLQQIDSSNQDTEDSSHLAQAAGFSVEFPDIDLVDHRDQTVALNSLFDSDKNVVFAFFFSHCVSVCTTITMSLKSLQPELPTDTLIVMISIDPETDTPELLSSYAGKFQIDDSNWYLLTGDKREIVALQKEFEAYRGNKMNHTTSLFVKKSGSNEITEFKNDFSVISEFFSNNQEINAVSES